MIILDPDNVFVHNQFLRTLLLVSIAFIGLYIVILMFRVLLDRVNTNLQGPFYGVIRATTTPLLKLLRRIFPTTHTIDGGGIAALILTQFLLNETIALYNSKDLPWRAMTGMALADIVQLFADFALVVIIIRLLSGWYKLPSHDPFWGPIKRLTNWYASWPKRLLPGRTPDYIPHIIVFVSALLYLYYADPFINKMVRYWI